jgi:hypothetical protein
MAAPVCDCQSELVNGTSLAVIVGLGILVLIWATERVLMQIIKDLRSPAAIAVLTFTAESSASDEEEEAESSDEEPEEEEEAEAEGEGEGEKADDKEEAGQS